MNIVRRKLRQAEDSPPSSPGSSSSAGGGVSSDQLGLQHLKKLFNEYSNPKEVLTDPGERDARLYNMLPLFCKVFGRSHASDLTEKFWGVHAFAKQVSSLMVSEIRRRASNQSTEAAAIAIVKFLEIETCEESSNGWMLLSTLNLLTADASIIQTMTQVSVPSTMVKCLYLFFDLPEIVDGDEHDEASDFSPNERRILLQKVFVQLLVRLCSYPHPAEELARMDDLTLLFSAITSQCPLHNILWRKAAAETLTTLSRHGLSPPVVNYIHNKACVALCIDNMQRCPDLSPFDGMEMFVAIFCFLKDSSEVSQTLLDDFRACHGYTYLIDFLLQLAKMENGGPETDAEAAIRNLILMIASLCMCGYTELRPSQTHSGSIFQMQGFQMPQISARGSSVRNIHAFQALQTTFLRSASTDLCCLILDAISSIYHSDNVNYFILETHNTLSQFTEIIHTKSVQIQEKFFALLEFIVFQLNFVPCKELISCSLLLKTNQSVDCSIICMATLLRILRYNNVFKDVFREVGILEVFVACLQRYERHISNQPDDEYSTAELDAMPEETLGKLTLEAISALLFSNNNNAKVFRECGGSKTIHDMILPYKRLRTSTLDIVRELILAASGEDDLLFLLTTMHSASVEQIDLKIEILKLLLGTLKESHRTRTLFRKVGGFVYVTSVFVSLDGKLREGKKSAVTVKIWEATNNNDDDEDEKATADEKTEENPVRDAETDNLLLLLTSVFQTLATAMRFEPANAKFFHHEICTTSFCDTLRLLGCFGAATELSEANDERLVEDLHDVIETFHKLFLGSSIKPDINLDHDEKIPHRLTFICLVYRLLYDCALDNFEKPNLSGVANIASAILGSSSIIPVPGTDPRHSLPALNLGQPVPEPLIVHPGIVTCMLQLLPAVEDGGRQGLALQLYLAEVLKSLVRSERNQQIMCEVGMAAQLLTIGQEALSEEKNLLHVPLQYMLERLAAQALQPTELRQFLRLGQPLHCNSPDMVNPYRPGPPIPLTRIKTLVSMTTPRDLRAHGSCTLPPFVEFDMSSEGFGCLFLPSIAPQAINSGGTVDAHTIGGIGSGERMFPPQTGLTYSTWFCVDKFSDPRSDPHSVRLLTVIRTVNTPREDNIVCLTLLLSARDKAIIVSTQETLVPGNAGEWEPDGTGDNGARIWCPDLLHEGQWHHLVAIFNRQVLKNSSFSLYLDGQHMHTQKLHYISQNPGAASTNLAVASSVFAFVGSPPAWRRYSRLNWKQGVCHLLEDIVSPQVVATIFRLGPHYMGSLQAPHYNRLVEYAQPLVPEERVIFGINAKAVSQLTLARIRKVYSRCDNKTIAKQLGISSHDNATPIRILHNSAGHLAGSARTLGGVVVGYLGVRVFCPHPVSSMIETVGGCNVLLGIIGMAQDVESLYAGVKALTCVVRSNQVAQSEMNRKRSYQTLAMFFKRKRSLLNSHILHLTFSLVGTVNSGQDSSSAIPNVTAFQDLLCDLEVWHLAPNGLLKSLLEHLFELASESSEKRTNIRIMRELRLVNKLLHLLDDVMEDTTLDMVFALLHILLGGQQNDLLHFGQFMVSKLPSKSIASEEVELQQANTGAMVNRRIMLRNKCLSILHALLFTVRNTVSNVTCDEISRVLGLDCLMLFLQPQVHPTTVIWTMRILVVMCSNETIIGRFRDGFCNGGYLRNTELVSRNKNNLLVAPQLSPSLTSSGPGGGSVGGVGSAMAGGEGPTVAGVNMATATSVISAATSGVTNSVVGGGGNGNSGGGDLPQQIAAEVKTAVLRIPGFQYLEWLMPAHLNIPEVYYLVVALIMGQPVKGLTASDHRKLDLDKVWAFLWGGSSAAPSPASSPRVNFCPEAVCILMAIVRRLVNLQETTTTTTAAGQEHEWLRNHPETIIQIMFSLYHNLPDFMPVMMSSEVVTGLASILFPYPSRNSAEPSSAASTPEETMRTVGMTETVEKEKEGQLSGHPVQKFVIDFLRVIIVDSLSLAAPTGKAAPVIDLVLDAGSPEFSTTAQQVTFQTEIITALIDHLIAADVLVGEQAALPIVPLLQSHVHHVAPNVFYLTARIVDKLWQGQLVNKDPHEVFDFIVKLIGQSKRRSNSASLEQLHHSLNRTILYLLSRPLDTVPQQMSVLETLHKLTTNRLLIFGAGNHELDFVGCLCYCLLQLTADMRIMLDSNQILGQSSTKWHCTATVGADMVESRDELLNQHQGKNLIAGAALRVWEELYVCKKPAIEEVFKVSLSAPVNNAKAPNLLDAREFLIDAAVKTWAGYLELERKSAYRVPWELPNQIQSKIQKVTGGLSRLASRSKVKKDELVRAKSQVPKWKAFECTEEHVQLVRELWELRCQQHVQVSVHNHGYVLTDWLKAENELTRERGLWGPMSKCKWDKWLLDTTEGPHRMRKKTMRNDLFYIHYPYRREYELPENRHLKYKVAISLDSKQYTLFCQQPLRVLCEIDSIVERKEAGGENEGAIATGETTVSNIPCFERTQSESAAGEDGDEDEEDYSTSADSQTLVRMLEDHEKITHMFRCARIQGLDTTEGLLLFGKEFCYVIDGFTVLKNREIMDIDSIPAGAHDPILPNPGSPRRSHAMRLCSKFAYEDIREVHKRRYLLQPIALEVFSGDGRNYLLSFPRKVRNKVYQRFMTVATSIADSAAQSVAGQKRTASVEQSSGIFSSLIGETSVTQRWVRGEISNFQYLMHLNTLAGRSYNDLMQYPVFPWILADYESEELDLTNPASFRDFSAPMGGQSTDRLEQFQKRFKEWDDPGETPPYFYGTHYSSAMIVCSYLVRLEPFTQHFLRLQGGHFDLADRLFHSIKEAWLSASKLNMADVKELIPEFFYLPEFLQNSNNFDLGTKQNGESLNDVILPMWAKQDAREFIRLHRQALECDYVSQNLHQWIDLIFGYRQQGQPAVEASNVFHHLFYEGNVDIYNIDDPLKKNATIGFINNFGQIPKQLFKRPHPSKKMSNFKLSVIDAAASPLLSSGAGAVPTEKLFFHNLDNLKPSSQPIKELKGPVGQILQPDKTVLAVEQNKVLMAPAYNKYIAWGFADHSLRIGMYDSDRAIFVCETTAQNSGEILACACPNAHTIITAGTNSVVTIWHFDARRKALLVKHSLHGHTDAVTCLAASPAYNVIVSGSRDGTAILWDMSRFMFVRQLGKHSGVVAAVAINELTGEVATCSGTWLHVWSINGDPLATVNTSVGSADRMQQILCVTFSAVREWDPQNVVITGSTDGVVRMWAIEYVQVPIVKERTKNETGEESIPGQGTGTVQLVKRDSNGSLPSEEEEEDLSVKEEKDESSIKEEGEEEEDEEGENDVDDDESPTKVRMALSVVSVQQRRPSLVSAKSLHEQINNLAGKGPKESDKSKRIAKEEVSKMRPSKSDTSISDSFVVVDSATAGAGGQNMLRSGFQWQRQLLFRSKLTMHTAYDRKDNAEPASITAMAVSKDHRTLYIGDARGRVFSWSVTEQPGKTVADHWLKDEGADQCVGCSVRFTLYERKHHCRNCGQVFCNKCSRFESEISRLKILKPVRVCKACFATLKQHSID